MSALKADKICELIREQHLACLDSFEAFREIESTNSYLLGQPRPAAGRYRVAVADYQSAGRGRMERSWISPPSTGLCLSMAFTFNRMPKNFPSLSLAVGTGVARALDHLGARGIAVKWPNDIVSQDGKIGGILSEVVPPKDQSVTVVVGVGLNLDFGDLDSSVTVDSRIGLAVDLASCCDNLPSRVAIAAALVDCLFDTMVRFDRSGFSPFHESWPTYDWLHGREVTIETPAGSGVGIADGVDIDGALLVNSDGDRQRYTSGSVTLGRHAGEHP